MTTLGTGGLLFGLERPELSSVRPAEFDVVAGGELLGRVEFANEGRVDMDTAFGSELDGRLFTSLDGMSEKSLVTPKERFYLRTRASKLLPNADRWKVAVDGSSAKRTLTMDELRESEKPLGLHLLECAGNTRAAHFGMISVANWAGVPISELFDDWKPSPQAQRVLVNGFDRYAANS